MYIRIVLVSHRPFLTSTYSFSSGVGYVMRPILLIMWTALKVLYCEIIIIIIII